MEGTGFILPDFVFCLLLGVVIRNLLTFTKIFQMSANSVDTVGGVALSLFLVMALMTMKLLDLINLAGPLSGHPGCPDSGHGPLRGPGYFSSHGRNYDAAIMAAGHVGFGMSSTACALAIMKAVTSATGFPPWPFSSSPWSGLFHRHPERDHHPGFPDPAVFGF